MQLRPEQRRAGKPSSPSGMGKLPHLAYRCCTCPCVRVLGLWVRCVCVRGWSLGSTWVPCGLLMLGVYVVRICGRCICVPTLTCVSLQEHPRSGFYVTRGPWYHCLNGVLAASPCQAFIDQKSLWWLLWSVVLSNLPEHVPLMLCVFVSLCRRRLVFAGCFLDHKMLCWMLWSSFVVLTVTGQVPLLRSCVRCH